MENIYVLLKNSLIDFICKQKFLIVVFFFSCVLALVDSAIFNNYIIAEGHFMSSHVTYKIPFLTDKTIIIVNRADLNYQGIQEVHIMKIFNKVHANFTIILSYIVISIHTIKYCFKNKDLNPFLRWLLFFISLFTLWSFGFSFFKFSLNEELYVFENIFNLIKKNYEFYIKKWG